MNYSSIARNTMIAFAAQFISLSVSVVMSLLVPKIVGVADYGYWQLFMFYTTYSGFFHLGLNDGVYLINGGLSRDEIDKSSIKSQYIWLFGGFCGRDSGIGPAQRAKTTIWN